jgi:hypothetical protein
MNRRGIEEIARPVIAGLVVLVTLIAILGFAIRDPRPHDLAVGLVAPAPVAQQLTAGFGQAAPGAFAFTTLPSEHDARQALDDRDLVATLIVDQAGPRLVVAGAAGDAISGGVTSAMRNAFQAQGQQLAVEVVHPFQAGDPHGVVLFFLVLATIVASAIAGALTGLATAGRSWAAIVAGLATYAVLAGSAGALMGAWLSGGYGDAVWAVMAICGLLSLAVAAAVAGFGRLLGPAGVGLAVLVIVPIGLISSGGPLGTEFLPDAYRAIAPWLPVGPAYGALRGALYFGYAGTAWPILLLAVWAAAALALLGAPRGARQAETNAALVHA